VPAFPRQGDVFWVLGFQSNGQAGGTFGRPESQTIVENCSNTLILRCSASEGGGTAQFASRLIGDREIVRNTVTRSRTSALFQHPKSAVSRSVLHVVGSAVLPSEIEQLPDLAGYLKLASQPTRLKVTLVR